MVNPVLAPRWSKCYLCRNVASIEDVTMRLFDEQLNRLPTRGALDYLKTLVMDGTDKTLRQRVLRHRDHVQKWLDAGAVVVPGQVVEGVSRIPEPTGPVRWIDANQRGMDVGQRALEVLEERLRNPFMMEDKDVIAAAKLGQSAARTRADLEIKGALRRADQIGRLASGFAPPTEA